MSKYLLVYRGGAMPEGQEATAKVMEAWGAWSTRLGSALADLGNPAAKSRTISPNGAISAVGDSSISGYTVIAADSLDGAVALAKDCPVLQSGSSIEVVETFEVM